MRVMIDTNIFISAALFPGGKASAALVKALVSPYQPVTCDYVIDELHRKFQEKFPDRLEDLNAFLNASLSMSFKSIMSSFFQAYRYSLSLIVSH